MQEKENLNKENEEKKKKKGFVAWWGGLTNPIKGLIIGGTTVALASAIVFPTLAATIWNKSGSKPVEPEPAPVKEWYEDETYINSLGEDDVGKTEKEILVNGQKHKVRLIGINHDDLADGSGKARTTWEFANLISDKDGYSLAYQWNDTDNTSSANYDYINSTIRYALTGEGTNGGKGKGDDKILVARKGKNTWSKNEGYNKTILSMLPSALASKLKTVKKSVGTTSGYTETSYTDKLFMPSVIELGYISNKDKGFGSTYKYYKKTTTIEDSIRIKKQVKNELVTTYEQIQQSSEQKYLGNVNNYAGYNHTTEDTGGGKYWLRSPSSYRSDIAWGCDFDGIVYYYYVFNRAIGVAPAFCL